MEEEMDRALFARRPEGFCVKITQEIVPMECGRVSITPIAHEESNTGRSLVYNFHDIGTGKGDGISADETVDIMLDTKRRTVFYGSHLRETDRQGDILFQAVQELYNIQSGA